MQIVLFGSFIDYQIQLANALSQKEEVMWVLPLMSLPEEFRGTIDKKVIFYVIRGRRPIYHPANLFGLSKLLKTISQFKPDVVHFQLGGDLIDLTLFLYCKFLKRCPIVVTFHDVKTHMGEQYAWIVHFARFWERKCADEIIVHGERLKQQMIEEYHLPSEKVHAIHIGEHEVAPFKKYEREDIKKEVGNLVLFFGRIWEYKGLEYLIKAEPLITKEVPNAKILIAGEGEDFKRYEQMMGDRRENFIIHNYRVSYKEGAELFQRCSIVVLPYIEASQSGVVPTAYGFKKPVVVTDVGSIPEVVDNEKTGFIVPPRDSEALAEKIIKLLKDEKLRKEMGENAYSKLKKDFSWDKIAEKTIEVYKKALEFRKGV
jgi:glycosyltransferase involved in cell wall biosynthesis